VERDPVEIDPMGEFESELRQAFERRPAPPGLKRRLRERGLLKEPLADGRGKEVRRTAKIDRPLISWQLLAACAALVAVLDGGVQWRHVERVRKAEAAREQVLTALRITSQALVRMNTRLAAHHRATPQD
jgi:hypothetical protein